MKQEELEKLAMEKRKDFMMNKELNKNSLSPLPVSVHGNSGMRDFPLMFKKMPYFSTRNETAEKSSSFEKLPKPHQIKRHERNSPL